jgi:hypothetical protein
LAIYIDYFFAKTLLAFPFYLFSSHYLFIYFFTFLGSLENI